MRDVRVFETAAEMERELVQLHVDAFEQNGRQSLSVALTGGSAANLYASLVTAPLDWRAVRIYFGDERCVGPEHADSNYRLANEKLLSKVPIPAANIHRVLGEGTPSASARSYEAELVATTDAGSLDFVHLGMGPDGHVCSLFPHHALLAEKTRLVASLDDSPKPPPSRITLTLPAIQKAKRALFLVMGEAKASVVREAIEDASSSLPAALVHRMGHATWLVDRAAASKLGPT
jgi:6-phosphogluconolactonase